MQMIEANYTQLTSLPLPSPALVIDTRGIEDDDVMDRLKVEIADLANEMKTQDIHHWRYLTEFLSFWVREPIPYEEVNTLRDHHRNNLHNGHLPAIDGTEDASTSAIPLSGLTGKIDPSTLRGFSSPFFFQNDDAIASLNEDRPADVLQQNISKIVQEVDRLRNNRHVAVADLEKTMSGRSVKDATVRVIFLTDAERPDSLATTAVYAAHLKQFYARKGRPNQQLMINTVALCLNNSGEETPASDLKELLWNDGWEHLDALILTEDYREDAALIAGAIQTYLAELLLYVLMIVPPLKVEPIVRTPQPGRTATNGSSSIQEEDTKQEKPGRNIPFPDYTFLIGLAAMEHSARWGRRLLNYRIVERAIEVLQKDTEDERKRTKNLVTSWLNNWRIQVKSAIPHKIPGNVSALQAFPLAENAMKPAERIFASRNFGLTIGKSTIKDLEDYRDNLVRTYTLEQTSTTTEPKLQDAIDSIPQIQRHLREWENKDPALRKGTPLVNAQVEAQRLLSNSDFFTGASGAIPRARMQLEELSTAVSNFRNEHQQNPIDLSEKSNQLKNNVKNKIEVLQQHIDSIPFLAAVLNLKQALAVLTFILTLFTGIVITFVGVAWIRHSITYFNTHSPSLPLPDPTQAVNDLFLLSSSPFALIFWLIVLSIVLAASIYFGRKLIAPSEPRSPLTVEVIFWLSLITLAIFGLVISFSLVEFASDPNSLAIIYWLSFLPILGIIILIIALVISAVEIGYFAWWYNKILKDRARIVSELDEEHKEIIDAVKLYIGDTIALHMLTRSKLSNEKGGPGEYFQRVNQLNVRLRDILENAQKQQRLARKRLAMSVSETQLGAGIGSQGTWLNLRIRDELLDVNSLADGYNRLAERIGQEIDELKEFSELLLRVMGEESTADIEQDFRERSPSEGSIDQHYTKVMMTTLVAMALRLSINATSIYSMTPLIQQYDHIADNLLQQPTSIKSLIDGLRKKLRQNMLQPILERSARASEIETHTLATSAIAAWGQMLWEGKDSELDRALSDEGVLPKLLEDGNNVHMVKRLLGLRTSLFGRNFKLNQIGALYLLMPSSQLSHQFRQELNLPRKHIINFPDIERLMLLYVQHYAGKPLFIPDPPQIETVEVAGMLPEPAATSATSATTATDNAQNMQAEDLVTAAASTQSTNGSIALGSAETVTPAGATTIPLNTGTVTSTSTQEQQPQDVVPGQSTNGSSVPNNALAAPDAVLQTANGSTTTQTPVAPDTTTSSTQDKAEEEHVPDTSTTQPIGVSPTSGVTDEDETVSQHVSDIPQVDDTPATTQSQADVDTTTPLSATEDEHATAVVAPALDFKDTEQLNKIDVPTPVEDHDSVPPGRIETNTPNNKEDAKGEV